MTTVTNHSTHLHEFLAKWSSPSRREFLKTSGRLLVGVAAAAHAGPLAAASAQTAAAGGSGPYPDLDFRQLDSWIVIHQDNTATFYVGKTDLGQGTGTAFRQIMSDELDMAFERTTCIMGHTDRTVDQGGSGGSDALQVDGQAGDVDGGSRLRRRGRARRRGRRLLGEKVRPRQRTPAREGRHCESCRSHRYHPI